MLFNTNVKENFNYIYREYNIKTLFSTILEQKVAINYIKICFLINVSIKKVF